MVKPGAHRLWARCKILAQLVQHSSSGHFVARMQRPCNVTASQFEAQIRQIRRLLSLLGYSDLAVRPSPIVKDGQAACRFTLSSAGTWHRCNHRVFRPEILSNAEMEVTFVWRRLRCVRPQQVARGQSRKEFTGVLSRFKRVRAVHIDKAAMLDTRLQSRRSSIVRAVHAVRGVMSLSWLTC